MWLFDAAASFQLSEVISRRSFVLALVERIHYRVWVAVVFEPECVPQLVRKHPHQLCFTTVLPDIYSGSHLVADIFPFGEFLSCSAVEYADRRVDVRCEYVVFIYERVYFAR